MNIFYFLRYSLKAREYLNDPKKRDAVLKPLCSSCYFPFLGFYLSLIWLLISFGLFKDKILTFHAKQGSFYSIISFGLIFIITLFAGFTMPIIIPTNLIQGAVHFFLFFLLFLNVINGLYQLFCMYKTYKDLRFRPILSIFKFPE